LLLALVAEASFFATAIFFFTATLAIIGTVKSKQNL
jgi:hypothetical protein